MIISLSYLTRCRRKNSTAWRSRSTWRCRRVWFPPGKTKTPNSFCVFASCVANRSVWVGATSLSALPCMSSSGMLRRSGQRIADRREMISFFRCSKSGQIVFAVAAPEPDDVISPRSVKAPMVAAALAGKPSRMAWNTIMPPRDSPYRNTFLVSNKPSWLKTGTMLRKRSDSFSLSYLRDPRVPVVITVHAIANHSRRYRVQPPPIDSL